MKTSLNTLYLIIAVCFLTACLKTPLSEINEVKILLDSARLENVQDIYPNEFKVLKDSVDIVLEGIESQRSKFLIKNYTKYKVQLYNLTDEIQKLRQKNFEDRTSDMLPENKNGIQIKV